MASMKRPGKQRAQEAAIAWGGEGREEIPGRECTWKGVEGRSTFQAGGGECRGEVHLDGTRRHIGLGLPI